MTSIKKQLIPIKIKEVDLNKSAGILDDFAIRKNIDTREGTIQKTPVNDFDLVNKKYVDDEIVIVESDTNLINPVGSIVMYGGSSAPSGWLLCDGAEIIIEDYILLTSVMGAFGLSSGYDIIEDINSVNDIFTIEGHSFSNGDIVRFENTYQDNMNDYTNYYIINTTTDTFQISETPGGSAVDLIPQAFQLKIDTSILLPDFRGCFPRGVGTSTKFTQDHTTTLGTYENDATQGHYHGTDYTLVSWPLPAGGAPGGWTADWAGWLSGANRVGQPKVTSPTTDGTNGTPRTANETRPNNLGINFIIKY